MCPKKSNAQKNNTQKNNITQTDKSDAIKTNSKTLFYQQKYVRRKQLMVFLLVLFMFSSCSASSHALAWSEMLFNPIGSDDKKEFVELVGNDALAGCTIRDSSSTDTLVLVHPGSDVILILENNSTWLDAGANATVYTIGSAIGNGLGNTYEELTISCANTTLLTTSYNTTTLQGFKEGYSIVFNERDEQWLVANNTPGVKNEYSNAIYENNTALNSTETNNDESCDSSLDIFLSTTKAYPEETIFFRIESQWYASFEVWDDAIVISNGDTLRKREFSLVVPQTTKIKIVAYAEQCGGVQRATRTITVLIAKDSAADANSTLTKEKIIKKTMADAAATNSTQKEKNESDKGNESAKESENSDVFVTEKMFALSTKNDTTALTGAVTAERNVVYDKSSSTVPWIVAFSMVVVTVSAIVFLDLVRKEKPIAIQEHEQLAVYRRQENNYSKRGAKYIRTRKAHQFYERKPSTRIPKQRMGAGNRHL